MDRRIFGIFFFLLLISGGVFLYRWFFAPLPDCEHEDFKAYFESVEQGIADTLVVNDTVRLFGEIPAGGWMINQVSSPEEYFAFANSGQYLAEFFLGDAEEPCRAYTIYVKDTMPPKPLLAIRAESDSASSERSKVTFVGSLRHLQNATIRWRVNDREVETRYVLEDTILTYDRWNRGENFIEMYAYRGNDTSTVRKVLYIEPPLSSAPTNRVRSSASRPPNERVISSALQKISQTLAEDENRQAYQQIEIIKDELSKTNANEQVTVNGVPGTLSEMLLKVRAKTVRGSPVSIQYSIARIRGQYTLAITF